MGIPLTREQRRQLERINARQPVVLAEVPRWQWPDEELGSTRLRVLRSRDFLVQVFAEESPAIVRLSICRTAMNGDRWQDGITWDDMQRLKRECGYGNHDALEVFPSDIDVVNVANMRHIWVMRDPVSFAWRR